MDEIKHEKLSVENVFSKLKDSPFFQPNPPVEIGSKARTMDDWIEEKTAKQDKVMNEKYQNNEPKGLEEYFRDTYGDEAYEEMFDMAEIDKRLQEGRAKWVDKDEFVTLEEKDKLAAAGGEDPLADMKKLAGIGSAEHDRSSFEILSEKLEGLEKTLSKANRFISDIRAEMKLLRRLSVRK